MEKEKYNEAELQEFKDLIEGKLIEAKADYKGLRDSLSYKDHHGTEDTAPSAKMLEDGSETLSRDDLSNLANRQEKFITHLENALLRISNKTYGVCRETGKLIPKERLRAVPHATLSIEAKNAQ